MKKNYKLLAFILLPFSSIAQPTVLNAESYILGTTIKRVICDSTGAGPSGASQIWNFMSLNPTGDTMRIQNIAPLTVNPFPNANIAQSFPNDTMYSHLQQTATQTWYWGDLDSSSLNASIYYSNPLLVMGRPFTYMDTASDSFAYTTNYMGLPVTATGAVFIEADAYGTLTLPNGTFNNVLRVKTTRNEADSLTGVGMEYITITSYCWYSDTSHSPLLRIDSIVATGLYNLEFVDVQYLHSQTPTASVGQLPSSSRINLDAHLDNSGLLLNGQLENGRHYEMALFSVNGQKVYETSFAASGAEHRFVPAADLSAGSYILSIRKKGEFASLTTIKLVKQ